MMRSHARVLTLCSVALFVPLCIPLFIGRVFVWDDLAAFHLPIRHLYQQAIRSGDSMLWSPALFSGVYLFGEGQAGMAHPFHWLLYRLLPLGIAFNIELASSYVVAFTGMWMLLRRSLSGDAAWLGAMVFTFSGFNLLHLSQMNAIAVVAHLPWLLLATRVLLTDAGPRMCAAGFSGVVLILASQLLLGYPQYLWLALFTDAWFTLWILWRGALVSRVPLLAMAVALAFCVGGVQLLPTIDVLRHSVRATTALDFRLMYALAPVDLVQLWSPYAFAAVGPDFGVYDGALCTVSIAWVFTRWRELKRYDLVPPLLLFAAGSLLLALGRSGAIYPWLARLPGLASFRAPSRFVALVHFAFALIAAVAFEDVSALARQRQPGRLRRLWPVAVPIGLSMATAMAAAALVRSHPALAHDWNISGAPRAAFGFAIVGATTVLFVLAARGRPWTIPLLVILAAVDMGLWGYRYAWRIAAPRTVDQTASEAALPDAARQGDCLVPAAGQELTNRPVLRGYRLTGGYLGLNPRMTLDFDDPVSQRLAGAAWRFTGHDWARVLDAMPRARLVSEARRSDRIAADIRRIDIGRVSLVDRSIDGLSGTPGNAVVVSDRPGRIVIRVTARGRQLLVLTERFHEGWRAHDAVGEHAAVRVNGDYLGSTVEPGTQDVTFTFAPSSARNGRWLTVAGLALTLISVWSLSKGPVHEHIGPRREIDGRYGCG